MDYSLKGFEYFSNVRHDLLQFAKINNKNLKILEIGCGYGETLYFLKKTEIAEFTLGIDIFEDKKNPTLYKDKANIIFGDIEQLDLSEYEDFFDFIIFADVLEHILEPINVLEKTKKYLKKEGEILISMPNIRHFSSFIKIFIKGNFTYENSGIFDKTHLRFYCKKDINDLIINANFKTSKKSGSVNFMKKTAISYILNKVTFGFFEEFFSYQYFFKAKKN
jgi:2-polyprenyl-3-methyl-5-hydroxy-6-metoxy-1,4-benzoquinol methylase